MNLIRDIEQIKARFTSYWERENLDRPLISVMCPADDVQALTEPDSLEQQWLDIDFRYREILKSVGNYQYFAEALPIHMVNLGPGVLANFIGSPCQLDRQTVWFDRQPMISDITRYQPLRFDENSIMWRTLWELNEKLLAHAESDLYLACTDLGGTLDVAASLLGAENLLMEMYDHPDELTDLCEQIDRLWLEAFHKLAAQSDRFQTGYSAWMPLWRDRPWYPLQCDISATFSPALFEKFAKPSLQNLAKSIGGHAVYHLDGPQEIPHIDHILDIPEIDAIEWVPMPRNGWLDHLNPEYFPLYRKIQEKGRNLIFRSVNPTEIETLFSHISPKGVFLTTWVNSANEAHDLLKTLEKIK